MQPGQRNCRWGWDLQGQCLRVNVQEATQAGDIFAIPLSTWGRDLGEASRWGGVERASFPLVLAGGDGDL